MLATKKKKLVVGEKVRKWSVARKESKGEGKGGSQSDLRHRLCGFCSRYQDPQRLLERRL